VRGHDYLLRSTIAAIEARLDPARFVPVHRSTIVNLDLVTGIEPLEPEIEGPLRRLAVLHRTCAFRRK
jgi:DNA-binding LytR/AlgR family response regulator